MTVERDDKVSREKHAPSPIWTGLPLLFLLPALAAETVLIIVLCRELEPTSAARPHTLPFTTPIVPVIVAVVVLAIMTPLLAGALHYASNLAQAAGALGSINERLDNALGSINAPGSINERLHKLEQRLDRLEQMIRQARFN